MKLFIHLSLLIFPFFALAAGYDYNGYGNIKGIVSTKDGQPAAYVSVLIKNTGRGTITDTKGNFEIRKIQSGTYFLVVSLLSYSDSAITVEVKENETVLLNVQLHSTYAQLKEVIVRANLNSKYTETKTSESLRLNLPLNEVPQNIAVTSRQLMYDQGSLSLSEAFRTVSGVEKTLVGGLNDIVFSIRGTDATNNVFRNGIGGGYEWNQQEDVAMLEKIEFIKGPAGFMISLAEPGGIINNVTKQPVKEGIATINAGFGSYNLVRLTADFGGMLTKKGKFSYRLNTGIHEQDRAFQYSKASRYFICAALNYEPNANTSVTAEYNYMWGRTSGNNVDLPSIDGKLFVLPDDFAVANASTDRLTVTDNYYRIQLKHNFKNNWNLNAQIAYINGTWGGYMLNSDFYIPVSNDTLYRFSIFDNWRNNLQVAQAFINGKFYTGHKIEHKVLMGLDYGYATVKETYGNNEGERKFGLYIPRPDYYIPPDSLKNIVIGAPTKSGTGWIALYIQDNIKIVQKLILTIAGHFTHASVRLTDPNVPDEQKNTKYTVFTPRAGLTWLFTDDISVYALYDQSFLPQQGPSFEHKVFKPFTGYDIEGGMKSYFFSKKLSLNFSVFNIVKNNTLTADPLHEGFFIQTGQIISKGIDFDITGNITPSLAVNANYAYADAKITKDSDPDFAGIKNFGTPDHCVNLWLKYRLPYRKLKNVSFAMGYQYMGKRGASVVAYNPDKTKFMPVYNLLDAAISFRSEKFNVALNLYNIANIKYAVRAYFSPLANEWRYTPGEPVNFRLSFGVNLVHRNKG